PIKLQCKLNRARVDGGRERAAKKWTLHRRIGISEICVVKSVEHLRAELEAVRLGEEEVLENAEVSGVHRVSAQHVLHGTPKPRRLGGGQRRIQRPANQAAIPPRRVRA